jgi:hypothetical protein
VRADTTDVGNWRFDHVGALTVDLLWSNSTGSVLIGVIPSANGLGRVVIISGNEFTSLSTQAASVPTDSGAW